VRILVDQSGYELLNIGDVAMLQSCVSRLRRQWPDAEIMVISDAPERLAFYCPGTIAVARDSTGPSLARCLPRKPRLISQQAWKMGAPYVLGHRHRRRASPGRPRTAIQAVQAADLVVASGGAYLTDTWWWHAAGVLSLLSLAQRLGKPTAMFGQGIGPVTRRALRVQARSVLPGLKVIGLREDRVGGALLSCLGVSPGAAVLTGDDALELMDDDAPVAAGNALGICLRVAGYAGVGPAMAAAVGDLVVAAAAAVEAPVIGLPVSRYADSADIAALRALQRHGPSRAGFTVEDITTPQDLILAAASCRAVVTGSYHAAVFALAQGVPAVCLTRSPYYQAKFSGLRALFPAACFVVPLDAADRATQLSDMVRQAWQLAVPARISAKEIAVRLGAAGRAAYARLATATTTETTTGTGAEAPAVAHARIRANQGVSC
jgi:polysaccharide pyruvyl transferase WcaK-like protein